MILFKEMCASEKAMLLEVYLAGRIPDIRDRAQELITGNKLDIPIMSDKLKDNGLITVRESEKSGMCIMITELGKETVKENIGRLVNEVDYGMDR